LEHTRGENGLELATSDETLVVRIEKFESHGESILGEEFSLGNGGGDKLGVVDVTSGTFVSVFHDGVYNFGSFERVLATLSVSFE
jgi:hypothetical protein